MGGRDWREREREGERGRRGRDGGERNGRERASEGEQSSYQHKNPSALLSGMKLYKRLQKIYITRSK